MEAGWIPIIVVVCLALLSYAVSTFYYILPRSGKGGQVRRYAAYAVSAAVAITGSTDTDVLAEKAKALVEEKFGSVPDVDLAVYIGDALATLLNGAGQIDPEKAGTANFNM